MAREKIVDEQAAHELYLFAVNDAGLYRQRILPIIANLKRKIKRGVYDPVLALKLWKYAADDAAQRYTREYGEGKGYGVFTVPTRKETAAHLADHYMEHVRENPLPALAGLLKSHAASVGGHRGAKRRRVMAPRRVAPSGPVMRKNPKATKIPNRGYYIVQADMSYGGYDFGIDAVTPIPWRVWRTTHTLKGYTFKIPDVVYNKPGFKEWAEKNSGPGYPLFATLNQLRAMTKAFLKT
jgi:hypothetical protein